MEFFHWVLLGIGIVIIILLSVVANDLKEIRYNFKQSIAQVGSCFSFLQAIHHILEKQNENNRGESIDASELLRELRKKI